MQPFNIYKYLPRSATVTLLLFAATFWWMPALRSWRGFVYMLITVTLAVGIKYKTRLWAQDGLVIPRGFTWNSKYIMKRWHGKEFGLEPYTVVFSSEAAAQRLVIGVLMGLVLFLVPLVGFALQQQGVVLAHKLHTEAPYIQDAADTAWAWAQAALPGMVPQGDLSSVLGNVKGEVAHNVPTILASLTHVFLSSIDMWILSGISVIVIREILQDWNETVEQIGGVIERGISDDNFRRSLFRFLEFYQEGVALLLVGFLQVFLILSSLYGVLLTILPFDFSIGGIVLLAPIMGFITGLIWKFGGGIAGVVGVVLLLYFDIAPGLGYDYLGLSFSINIYLDMILKVLMLVGIGVLLGLTETYNFTPSIIGEKLGLTKLEMLSTVLMGIVGGGGIYGLIRGVFFLLLYQASKRQSKEKEVLAEKCVFFHRPYAGEATA